MIRLFTSFYLLLVVSVAIYVMSEPYIRSGLIRDLFVQNITKDYSGTRYLLEKIDETLDAEQFAGFMEKYPESSNIPVSMLSLNTLDVPKEGKSAMERGELHVADILSDIAYFQLADSDNVVKLGPLGIYAPLDRVRILYRISLFAVLAAVDSKVASLRKKLGDNASLSTRIITVRGQGYLFVPDSWA